MNICLKSCILNARITLECFHALTDGMGAMEFLKTLVYQYLLLIGKEVQDEGMVLLPDSAPEQQEEEDGCLRYYQKHIKKSKFETRKARAILLRTGGIRDDANENHYNKRKFIRQNKYICRV